MYEEALRAAEFIREKCGEAEIGLILGSGLCDSIRLQDEKCVNYGDVPGFPSAVIAGQKGEWACGTFRNKRVYLMRGRFHYYQGYTPEETVFPVRVMKLLGVKTLIVSNAAGCVNPDYRPGEIMVISDMINYSGLNPLIGENDERFGPRFCDMTHAFDETYRDLLKTAAKKRGIPVREGVYMWFSGPSYETPAEVRMARILGADAVGMSTVPEVIAARHCGLRVLGLTFFSNMAAGILDQPLSHEEICLMAETVKGDFSALVGDFVAAL